MKSERLTFLEKKFLQSRNYRLFFAYKNSTKFYRVELFKVNQIDIPDYQYYLGCNAKIRLTFLEKRTFFLGKLGEPFFFALQPK